MSYNFLFEAHFFKMKDSFFKTGNVRFSNLLFYFDVLYYISKFYWFFLFLSIILLFVIWS
ncbi:MAG TPA: hypothetical protein DHU85_04400 [Porphyromonadaceae bacterium]|nr:hypothetical protein [Porphyromonadaceae bacterium]